MGPEGHGPRRPRPVRAWHRDRAAAAGTRRPAAVVPRSTPPGSRSSRPRWHGAVPGQQCARPRWHPGDQAGLPGGCRRRQQLSLHLARLALGSVAINFGSYGLGLPEAVRWAAATADAATLAVGVLLAVAVCASAWQVEATLRVCGEFGAGCCPWPPVWWCTSPATVCSSRTGGSSSRAPASTTGSPSPPLSAWR